jgi:hypothetical protein
VTAERDVDRLTDDHLRHVAGLLVHRAVLPVLLVELRPATCSVCAEIADVLGIPKGIAAGAIARKLEGR